MPESSRHHDDESDHESVSELLSPSDGYFAEGRSHPGEVLMPDPSQGQSQLDKEREAHAGFKAEGSRSTNIPPPIDTSTQSRWSSRSSRPPRPHSPPIATSPTRQIIDRFATATERTPLISSAPPAYSPPEPGSPYHSQASDTNAGIYDTMGRPERFFPNTTQDMGGESEALLGGQEDKKRWNNRLSAWWGRNSNVVYKYAVLGIALLIAVGFVVDLIMELSVERNPGHDHANWPSHSDIPSSCKIAGSGKLDFTFEKAREFHLVQLPKPQEYEPHYAHVQNLGKIHVRAAAEDAPEDVKVDLEYYYSSTAVSAELEFAREGPALRIHSAGSIQNYNGDSSYRPCLYLNVTVWVKPNLAQTAFSIDAATLSVILEQNLTAKADVLGIQTLAGSITSIPEPSGDVHWGSRNIKIVTSAGSISGAYPLYDSLHLETHAGSITTDLTLNPGRHNEHSEALLVLKSQAGSITARTPLLDAVERGNGNATIDDIPKRDYHTDVDARTGSVHLQLAHGSRTSISVNAGTVHAVLTPWLQPSKDSHIVVDSNTGGVDIQVNDAIAYPKQALRNLYGDYRFATGHLSLRYPAEWEGKIHGSLMTGSIMADWPGLQVMKRQRLGMYYNFEGTKGSGSGVINFSGASGSATLLGKGGDRYPSDDKDHRRVVGGEDEELPPRPIVLPPQYKVHDLKHR